MKEALFNHEPNQAALNETKKRTASKANCADQRPRAEGGAAGLPNAKACPTHGDFQRCAQRDIGEYLNCFGYTRHDVRAPTKGGV